MFYKAKLKLNDWGYYKLIKAYSKQLCPDENSSILFAWYYLNKTGYDIRIAFSEDKLSLLVPSKQQLYNLSYVSLSDKIYYVINEIGNGEIKSYKTGYADATKIMDFNLLSPFETGDSILSRKFTINYKQKTYSFHLNYNPYWVLFFSDYPNGDLTIYFDAIVSPQFKNSIRQNLKPIIDTMNETDAANFLLGFVQYGFDYKRDQEQFGREKTFFPEETLFYPFSDCEDRAVFYSFLVKELLGNQIIGLLYKKHIATAISLSKQNKGDYLLFDGKRYYVADPTYIGALIGDSMTQYAQSVPKIIKVE